MKCEIDLAPEQIDLIVREELKWNIDQLKVHLRERKEGIGIPMYSQDAKEDCRLLKELLDAMKLVKKYYTPGGKE